MRKLRDRGRFHQSLEIECGVKSVISQNAQMPTYRAEEFSDRFFPKAASIYLDQVVDIWISAEYLGDPILDHPGNFRVRKLASYCRQGGQRVNDVADRAELYDENAHRLYGNAEART